MSPSTSVSIPRKPCGECPPQSAPCRHRLLSNRPRRNRSGYARPNACRHTRAKIHRRRADSRRQTRGISYHPRQGRQGWGCPGAIWSRETSAQTHRRASDHVPAHCRPRPSPALVPTNAILELGKRWRSMATTACVSVNDSLLIRKRSSTPCALSDGVSTSANSGAVIDPVMRRADQKIALECGRSTGIQMQVTRRARKQDNHPRRIRRWRFDEEALCHAVARRERHEVAMVERVRMDVGDQQKGREPATNTLALHHISPR